MIIHADDDFDEYGQWTGTCDDCGTSHDGYPPDTLGGARACIRTRLTQLADETPELAPAIGAMLVQFDALNEDIQQRGMDAVRRYFES